MSEADHQAALMRWARTQEATRPELKLLHAIPNGGYALSRAAGWLMKQRGVRAGVPDLCLPIARGGFHGLYVEMKDEMQKGKRKPEVSPEQTEWLAALAGQGYATALCYGWLQAMHAIERYLGLTTESKGAA